VASVYLCNHLDVCFSGGRFLLDATAHRREPVLADEQGP
jgi:hypothetical protein